ncbi:MAG: cupin domain-containing protein [Anaerolineae bacterium]|nr:cupin domain-containing protein [Anaerolineae bacterium]
MTNQSNVSFEMLASEMLPFATTLDMDTGVLSPVPAPIQRSLSQLVEVFALRGSAERILREEGDRMIYEVFPVALPENAAHVLHCTTVIYPGTIGGEYHMTKGHYHAQRDRGEVYLGIGGEGYLLLMLENGETRTVTMKPGTAAYVPPNWAHRTINTGSVPFTFFAAWPGDAGHDYGTIEQFGFAKLLVNQDGQPVLVNNPHYGSSS